MPLFRNDDLKNGNTDPFSKKHDPLIGNTDLANNLHFKMTIPNWKYESLLYNDPEYKMIIPISKMMIPKCEIGISISERTIRDLKIAILISDMTIVNLKISIVILKMTIVNLTIRILI